MLKKILKGLAGLLVFPIVLAIAVFVATSPARPPAASNSARYLASGPFPVASADFLFVDESRPTNANRGVPGKSQRSFPTTIWYPDEIDGAHPLIVHSHGIVSSRSELAYLMEHMASYGYVMVATDYPLTSGATEGGANANDVINQPADISFLIDSVLGLSEDEQPFDGSVDQSRIGLTGYSLGGLTTLLTTYHPELREPRVAAGVAIAGPAAAFTEPFYATTAVPFLMISGTADSLIETQVHAVMVPERNPGSSLLTIEGGTHLGFVGAAEPAFRFMQNPDSLGCAAVLSVLDEDPNEVFGILGSPEQGIDMPADTPPVCAFDLRDASHPGRQQMITQVAVLAFFEAAFSTDSARRSEAATVLSESLAQDFSEATVR